MIYAGTLGRRRARRLSAWIGSVAVTTPLAAQDVDPAAYEHLVEPRIVKRALGRKDKPEVEAELPPLLPEPGPSGIPPAPPRIGVKGL